MKIQALTIENFRCVRSAHADLRALTGFVGRNGAGKSTFLQALQLFYAPSATVTPEDYYANATTEDIAIQITYGDLRPEEKAELEVYMDGDTLTVTKRFPALGDGAKGTAGKYFASQRVFPPFQSVRKATSAADRKATYNDLIDSATLPPDTPKAKKDSDVYDGMKAFEAAHSEVLKREEMETQLFGEKSVGSGKIEKFTRFVYVPAVRDVTDEAADRKASFAQLLELVVTPKIQARPEVQQLPAKIQALVDNAYDKAVIGQDLATLASDLNGVLKPFVGDARLSFDLIAPDVKPSEPRIVPTVTEDSFAGELSRKGHGLQRAIIFTVLSHLARIRSGAAPESQPDLILAVEEPELYQHPSRCRQIASVLRQLSEASAPGNQVLFTTHSPYFLDIEHFEDVRIVRKAQGGGGAAESAVTKLTFDAIRETWARCCEKEPKEITRTSLASRLTKPFLTSASEGFFADVVVLVEGAGDAALLLRLAERMKKSWDERGVVVIRTDGKANLGAPWLVFQAFNIPTYVLFDGDVRYRGRGGSDENQATMYNKFLQRAGGIATPEAFPATKAGATFACLEDELETACKNAVGDEAYSAALSTVGMQIGSKPSEVLNNATGAALFLDHVYDSGDRLPFAEQIVEAITAFAEAAQQPPIITPVHQEVA
ncbi:MAG: ATP-dependent endonuclease [Thermoanaerobaculia bacterium]